MLTSVRIENYRGFKSFQMEGLARVNLLVGKNNCGKTALLEGIQFLASGGDPGVLADAAGRRGEYLVRRDEGAGVASPRRIVDVAHFFFGHVLALAAKFQFTGHTSQEQIKSWASVAPSTNRGNGPSVLRVGNSLSGEREEFPISRDGGVDLAVTPYWPFERSEWALGRPGYFVGPDSMSSSDLAAMWDELTENGRESDIVSAMRILDGNIESMHFLTGVFASGHFPARGGIVVGLKGQESRVPLGSMGDGMRRLMALATALAFTRSSCLFVDEIDTGLHYSAMPDMWKLAVSTALASNTQIFATTHSWDCIEGLSQLCQDEPKLVSEVAVHKISPGLARSIPFSSTSLVRMVKSDIDPRS